MQNVVLGALCENYRVAGNIRVLRLSGMLFSGTARKIYLAGGRNDASSAPVGHLPERKPGLGLTGQN